MNKFIKSLSLTTLMCCLLILKVSAQCTAPLINSFSPNTGFIGSTITITGGFFNTTPANNIVYFGATKATVLTASFGTLTVTAPAGASTALISVTNTACNLTGYSSVPFNGIFCPTPLNANTYNNTAFNLGGISGAYNMLTQDMDGDGKPEIISCLSGLTIAKNNSTPGVMSFQAFNFGGGGSHVATADFDGDGKRDILAANNVYRNTSTGPGNINLQAFGGYGGYQGNVGDFNNDGKIDIIAGTNLYRNTSTGPGVISFAYAGSISNSATGIQCADVDGDGKTDILCTEGGGNRAATFRNVTAQGATTFTFQAPEYWPSIGLYPYRCQIADFDKDGRIDLCTPTFNSANNTTNTTVWRNLSTPGDIVFGTANNYPGPNGNYRIAVGDVDGDGYPDIVTKSIGFASFDVYRNQSSGPGSISFGSRFTYPAAAGEVSGITIGDLDGDFVPDISTSGISSNRILVHRNNSSQSDGTPPTASCKNITVALSPTGTAVVTAAMIDNGSSDACGIGSLQINNSASVTFTCANIGANNVTLTVTDRAGNISTCTAVVNVAPAAIIVAGQTTVCQGQTVPLTANVGDSYQWQKDGVDIAGATAQTYTATESGNYTVTVTNAGGCSGTSAPTAITVNTNPTVSTTPSGNASLCPPNGNVVLSASTSSIYQWKLNGNNISGATQQNYTANQVGTYTVQVIDLFGCSATSAPIVVGATDNVPPVAICRNVTVALDANGNGSINTASINNGSFDNCGIRTITLDGRTNFTCADAGQTFTVTMTVTDNSNNSSSCTATVTVTDPLSVCNQPPTAVCQPLTLNADANCSASATAEAFNGGSTDPNNDALTYSVSPAGPYALGVTNVTLTVTDSKGASSTCTTTVTVVDVTAPTIIAPPNRTLQCDEPLNNRHLQINGNSAASKLYFTGHSVFGPQPHSVPLTADVALVDDGTPNTADACQSVQNNVAGKIVLIDRGNCLFIDKVIAAQNAGAVGVIIVNNIPNSNLITLGGTNNAINIPSVFVSKEDGDLMKAELANGTLNASLFNPDLIINDNCSNGLKVYRNVSNINQTCPRSYQEVTTWTVVDASGNTNTAQTILTIVDTQAPSLSAAPANTTVECDAVPAPATLTATDNCDNAPVVTFAETRTNGNCSSNYTLTRVWTARDACGNSSSKTQVVTVQDTKAPTASCKPLTVTLVNGTASITAADVNNGSNDNCGTVSLSISKTSFNCNNLGANTVTLTVTDECGNSSTCDATVTVVGEIPTCSIASVPTSNVFTGGVPTNLYLGYGAQSTTLQVSAPASGAPYTYSWSGSGLNNTNTANPVFTPTTAGNYTFSVLVTNKYGCTTTCSITICVKDIRVPGTGGKKVYVCHIPPGNPANAQTLSISVNAVPAHIGLHGGDRLGTCDMQPCGIAPRFVNNTNHAEHTEGGITLKASPNPSSKYFLINITSDDTKTPVTVRIVTGTGKMMEVERNIAPGSTIQVGDNLKPGTYFFEAVQGGNRKVMQLIKLK